MANDISRSFWELERYWFGPAAVTDIHCANGEWVLVFRVRPLELIAHWLGIPLRPYHLPLAVRYDRSSSQYRFAAGRLLFGEEACVLRGPNPLRRLWDHCPTFDSWLYAASDRLDRAVRTILAVVANQVRQSV